MIKIERINVLFFIVILITSLALLYGTSLSCNYNMTIKHNNSTYNGVCQFGMASWVEIFEDGVNDSTWYVNSFSFSYKNHLIYIITNREQIHKMGGKKNELDLFNIQFENIKILKYEYYDVSNHQLALFTTFPDEHIYIAELHGELSLLSQKENNTIP